jgi:hypothetical protein
LKGKKCGTKENGIKERKRNKREHRRARHFISLCSLVRINAEPYGMV